jgi:tetratricopeptide (TPR) repeat protein
MIEWIQWDSGGIAAAEYRDAAFKAENDQKWREAQLAYQAGIGSARTDKARNELTWRLALLEFRQSSAVDALTRMKKLIETVKDVPDDYRESYGKMLYAYAQTLQKSGDVRGALNYYLQSTKFSWSAQGAGYVEIARIASNDLDMAIEHATRALDYPLTKEQQTEAYRILADSYRAKGNWDKMKYYQQLNKDAQ